MSTSMWKVLMEFSLDVAQLLEVILADFSDSILANVLWQLRYEFDKIKQKHLNVGNARRLSSGECPAGMEHHCKCCEDKGVDELCIGNCIPYSPIERTMQQCFQGKIYEECKS